MANLRQFARNMTLRADRLEVNVNRVVRKTALAVDRAVVFSTPVDTGQARSNWLASIGEARTDVIKPYVEGSKLGRGETANASAAIAQAESVIRSRKPGKDIVLVNNVPYIEQLNNGKSTQSPREFVQIAIRTAADAIRSELRTQPIV